ncbi:MAG: hypothetical protein MMC23_004396 [Stictis urceolatum]|nr:hypothetical protein [Stictis urceolata]
MAEITVKASAWKLVELGRVVTFLQGEFKGRLAAIVEIIDHKRVLVDGPSPDSSVPRHSTPLSNVVLTPIVIPNLPRAIGHGPLKKAWEKHEVDSKWTESSAAKSKAKREKRRQLTDFERFKVMKLRKQARFEVRRTHAGIRKAAK